MKLSRLRRGYTGMLPGQWHLMNESETHLAVQFGLLPDEARILNALRESEDLCPHDCVHHNPNTRKVQITNLRNKLRGHNIAIRNIRGIGYRLEVAA